MKKLFLFLFLILPPPLFAHISFDDAQWEHAYTKDNGLAVYLLKVDGQPIKAVKATMLLDSSMEQFLNVLTDTEMLIKWIPVLSQAELLQETDLDGVTYMYMVTRLPWPVKDRDVVVKTTTLFYPETGIVEMTSIQFAGKKSVLEEFIRIPISTTKWRIKSLSEGKLEAEFITHSDPGGNIPGWLPNLLVSQTPKVIYSKLKKVLEIEKSNPRPFDSVFVFGKEVEL